MTQQQQQQQQQELISKITKDWADKGKIIEGGWQAYLLVGIHSQATDLQKIEMRRAYFLGAQHLFASIMMILDPGAEPTEKDLERLTLIEQELDVFTESLKAGAPSNN